MFSRRVPDDLAPNALARARRELGDLPFDLTVSNPTLCGIPYPPGLLAPLGRPEGLAYRPDPRGIASARRAVADDYRRHGLEPDPERIVLTASSSEAYAFLFRLLCDPGETVLVPSPSYPLLAHLAELEGLRPVAYRLDRESGWQPDPEEVGAHEARAVVVVHPNNPTGSGLDAAVASRLFGDCGRKGRALIADEVFLDYPLDAGRRFDSLAGRGEALSFTLGGLSKSLGLPQLKLSWIVVGGPERPAREALERLEFIADQYLSVATPVQLALPELLARGAVVRGAILDRCRANLRSLAGAAARLPAVSLVRPEGGWSAALRLPAVFDEEELALELLEREGLAVHPGHLFDFPSPGYLVLSLLPEPSRFARGAGRLVSALERRL